MKSIKDKNIEIKKHFSFISLDFSSKRFDRLAGKSIFNGHNTLNKTENKCD
jgi:hypothetical protein